MLLRGLSKRGLRARYTWTSAATITKRHLVDIPDPFGLNKVVLSGLEAGSEVGRQVVNSALAQTGSTKKFKVIDAASSQGKKDAIKDEKKQGSPSDSVFWKPYSPESPFAMGREAFLAKHLGMAVDSKSLLPDSDVEEYVDFLISEAVLSNVSLPPGVGRQMYISVVRIVQRVIINGLGLLEGEVLGKKLKLLKQASDISKFRSSGASEMDPRVIKLLAKRTVGDHTSTSSAYLVEMGIPITLVERLYEDVIALSVRLVLDVSLTFQIRCLGHRVTCQITPDDMLHNAPGWEVALDEGPFGLFDDEEKRRWAQLFVDDLLKDKSIKIQEVPEAVQREMYARVTLLLLNLSETALNHFRLHVAGMAFRPALLEVYESSVSFEPDYPSF